MGGKPYLCQAFFLSVKINFDEKTAPPPVRNRWFRLAFWMRLATYGLLLVTAAGQGLGRWYPFELLSHFPVVYAAVALLLTGYWIWQRQRLFYLALGLLLWNGALVAPWLLASQPTAALADLRVLHANVLFKNEDYGPILAMIEREQPDLCVIAEATPALYEVVRKRLPQYPCRSFSHAKSYCWNLVLSRTPFIRDSAALRDYRAVALRTRIRGREVGLVTVHPRTPIRPGWFSWRNTQLRFAFDYARRQSIPTLLVGDFNVTPWSPVYRELTQKPGLTACRKGFGGKPTWIAPLPVVQLPIDHVFVNDGLRPVSFRTLPPGNSDHRPVVAEVGFK